MRSLLSVVVVVVVVVVVGPHEVVVPDVADIGDIDRVSDAPQGWLDSRNYGGLDKHFAERISIYQSINGETRYH